MEKNLLFNILERIGSTPRGQLSWLVRLVEGRAPQTPEDWGNLRRELAVFAMHTAGTPSFGLRASDKDPQRLLNDLPDILKKAARRQTIGFPLKPTALGWNANKGRYVETVDPEQDNFRNAVLRGVKLRLREYGHVLKECQAPAKLRPGRKPKGKPKPEPGVCGRLFVASKQTQLYCPGGACLSRSLTRKKRAAKKANKMRKPKRMRARR